MQAASSALLNAPDISHEEDNLNSPKTSEKMAIKGNHLKDFEYSDNVLCCQLRHSISPLSQDGGSFMNFKAPQKKINVFAEGFRIV